MEYYILRYFTLFTFSKYYIFRETTTTYIDETRYLHYTLVAFIDLLPRATIILRGGTYEIEVIQES